MESLAHAARVALDAFLLAPVETDHLEQLADARPLLPRVDPVELGEVAQVVERREALVEAAVTAEDVADALAHPVRVLDDVAPEDARLPRRRDQQGDEHLDRRRLPGPVRPEQAEQLALLDREAHAAHRLDLERAPSERPGRRPVGAVEIDRFDDGGHDARLYPREVERHGGSLTCHASGCESWCRLRRAGSRAATSNARRRLTLRFPYKEGTNETTRMAGAGARGCCGRVARIHRGRGLVEQRGAPGRRLRRHDQAPADHAAHRWCRPDRQRAAQLGEVRGEEPRPEVQAERPDRRRRHPGREGLRRGAQGLPEVHRRLAGRGGPRTGDLGRRRLREQGADQGRARPHLAVGHRHRARGRPEGEANGDAGVLPCRRRGLRPGADGRALHDREAEGEEGRDRRLPGAVLGRSRASRQRDSQGRRA